ncbi:hypothetical protein CAEBREN_07395 [Caenorhabditis brenneri]|uniref:SPK domain-containing protein n=1 Tax=Caenorhabditis brenneri TaxID=135651 RepID=G0ME85_CAEBE|nr:hypothetical protein CAEBREN_07395 [Caenorhabditis brenneri]
MVYESDDDGSWKEQDEENKDEKEGDDKEDCEKEEEEEKNKEKKDPESLDYEDFLCQFVIQTVRKFREPLTRTMFDSFRYVNKAGGGQKHYNHIKRWLYQFNEKRQDSNRFTLNELATLFFGLSIKGTPYWFKEEMRIKQIDYSVDEWTRLTFFKHGDYTIKGRHRKIPLVGEKPEEEENEGTDDTIDEDNYEEEEIVATVSADGTMNNGTMTKWNETDRTMNSTFLPPISSTPKPFTSCQELIELKPEDINQMFGVDASDNEKPIKCKCMHVKLALETSISYIKKVQLSSNPGIVVVGGSVVKEVTDWWSQNSHPHCTLQIDERDCVSKNVSVEEIKTIGKFFKSIVTFKAEKNSHPPKNDDFSGGGPAPTKKKAVTGGTGQRRK